ncbi:hypothetical protein QBC37DRAFT_169673 [Rhypophila decipiens]|uniref:Uncharacterized protein n=1 Tax=Rhypophila decipiens TaxID=261697 RepID=A0AAN6Y6R8_9PEZI|nr:hypothetical protein QBC37DRAFT_169673 [Rhypophila decipiens]
MRFQLLSTMALVALAAALPLNINLGAYSPALVVGDGAISFEGGEGAEGLVDALQGAAVNEAAGRVQVPVAAPAEPPATPQVQAAQVAAAPVTETPILTEPAGFPEPGAPKAKELDPRISATSSTTGKAPKAKRDIAGFDRALRYAEAALVKGPKVELGTGAHGAGIGIIVDNNPSRAPPAAPAAGAGGAERRNNGIVVG